MIQIKKIALMCRAAKRIVLHDTAFGQWLGDGRAMYNMDGMPRMDRKTVYAVLEVKEDDRGTGKTEVYQEQMEGAVQYEEFPDSKDEILPMKLPVSLSVDGTEYMIFLAGDDLAMVDKEYMKPIKAREPVTFHIRCDNNGNMVIVVKEGAFIQAVMWPDMTVENRIRKYIKEINTRMND